MTSVIDSSRSALDAYPSISDAECLVGVQMAIATLRLGKPFVLKDGERHHFCMAVEGLSNESLAQFHQVQPNRAPLLVLTPERGEMLGFSKSAPISMPVTANDTPEALAGVAASHPAQINRRPILEQFEASAALELLAHAKMLPAILFYADIANAEILAQQHGAPVIDRESILNFEAAKIASLTKKSEAPIPVRGGIKTRMIVFQYATGENEIALLVGDPNPAEPLAIRIHSSCATGDIFGSERCDCGDQLRMAIEKLHELDGGAVLYLDQEGRGIGLVNKIRAYDLQDQELDTVDANHALGFADDRRNFAVAAAMIRALGFDSVSVLTNNPRKLESLREYGIEVDKRIAHQAPVNQNNDHYLKTKAKRSGHLLKY